MTPQEELAALRRLAELEAKASGGQESRPIADRARDSLNQFAQGASFGFIDEGKAFAQQGLHDLTGGALYSDDGQTYDERLAKIRGRMNSFEENNPVTSAVLQGTGGVASSIALPGGLLGAAGKGTSRLANTVRGAGQALSVAPKGAGIMAQSLRAGGQGAGYGAAHGAGNAEGGVVDRLEGAAGGGIIGLAAGLAAPPVINLTAKALQAGIEQVSRLLPEAWKRSTPAQRKVVEALLRDGLTPEQAALKMQQNPNFALVDVGPNTQGLARAAGTIPGEGKTTLTNFLRGRQEGTRDAGNVLQGGQANRITSALDDFVPESFRGSMDDLIATRRKDARPLYEAAFAPRSDRAGNTFAPWDERLQQFLDEPIVLQGLKKGVRIQQLEALADGVPFNPSEYAIQGFDDAGELIIGKVSNLRAMDAAKRGLDDILEEYRDKTTGKLVLTEYGRAIDNVRRSLVNKLDEMTTDWSTGESLYKNARAAWAGPSKMMDALSAGRDFMSKSIYKNPEELGRRMAELSPDEKHLFRIGAVQAMRDKTGDLVTRADATKRLMDIPNLESKIYQAFDNPEMYKKYIAMLQDEGTMFDSYGKVLTGSRTGEVAAEQADSAIDTGRIAQGVAEMAGGGVSGWLRGSRDVARGLKDRAFMSANTSKGLAELLSGRDTAGLAPAALKFAKNDAQRKQLVRLLMQIGAVEGGRAQGQ